MAFPRLLDNTRIPALDGIRGLAIGLVLVWHGFFSGVGAPNHPRVAEILKFGRLTWSGVDLFFVLSGFLIGGILLDARESERYFAPFYLRRAHRIVPLYFLVLAGALAFSRNHVPLVYYGTFLQNVWMARHAAFGSATLGVTWSLAVEEQFYLTLPLIIRYVPRRRLWWVVGGMITGAPLLRILLVLHAHSDLDSYYLTYVLMPCRADALGFGVAAALIVRDEKLWNAVLRCRVWLYAAFGGAFLAVFVLLASRFHEFSRQLFGLEYSLLALFYFLLLMSVLASERLQSLFSWDVLRYVGLIAYGLYLLHLTGLAIVRALATSFHPGQPGWMQLAENTLGIGLAFVAAAFSWKFIEKPLIKRGHRYRYEEKAKPSPPTPTAPLPPSVLVS